MEVRDTAASEVVSNKLPHHERGEKGQQCAQHHGTCSAASLAASSVQTRQQALVQLSAPSQESGTPILACT